MRKWHRWLSLFFGVFMLWIASTGVLSHVFEIAGELQSSPEQAAPAAVVDFTCPEGWRCIAPAPEGAGGLRSWVGFFHHLHSGETFGPIGTAISLLSGFALLFFSFSGLWMYLKMWGNRKDKGLKGGMFWK